MPTKRYAFEPGGRERVTVTWKPVWKNLQVYIDGQLMGTVERMQDLQQGREFPLNDGTTIRVQLEIQLVTSTPYLHVIYNGRPLPGSDLDPRKQFRDSCTYLLVLAGVFVLGGLARPTPLGDLSRIVGLDLVSTVAGLAFGLAGFWLMRSGSRVAVGIAVAIGLAELAWSQTGQPYSVHRNPLFAGLLRLAVIGTPLFALKELNDAERHGF